MHIQTEAGTARICLEGDLGLADAAQLKDVLLEAFVEHKFVEIDLQDVTGVDLSILQLICSGHRTASTSGKDLALINCGNGVLAQARRMAGFVRHRGCIYNPTQSCLWVGGLK